MLLIREGGHQGGSRTAEEEPLEITKEIGFHVFNKYAKKSLNSKCFSRLEKSVAMLSRKLRSGHLNK